MEKENMENLEEKKAEKETLMKKLTGEAYFEEIENIEENLKLLKHKDYFLLKEDQDSIGHGMVEAAKKGDLDGVKLLASKLGEDGRANISADLENTARSLVEHHIKARLKNKYELDININYARDLKDPKLTLEEIEKAWKAKMWDLTREE